MALLKNMKKRTKIVITLLLVVLIAGGTVLFNLTVYIGDSNYKPALNNENFRIALSVSPFSGEAFEEGYRYIAEDLSAANREELEKMYIEAGATEMYARIATKRYKSADNIAYGEYDSNANYHTLEQGLELCKMAAKLDIPINPEIMCAYTYMDMDRQQAPDFSEYPEIYELQGGKTWEELTLEEMCTVLKAYGEFVATEILRTGCRVDNWNMGNEANYGFAGVNVGLNTVVNEKLAKIPDWKKNILPVLGTDWLKDNVWKYNAKQMAAVAEGIETAYAKLGMDANGIKFSTHIATVVTTVHNAVTYFKTLQENGFPLDIAGISFYPSAPGVYINKITMFKKIVTAINEECNLPVFVAEFSYPSGKVEGAYAGWDNMVKGYPHNEEGQAAIYTDIVNWSKEHGLAGIRYWAPDFSGWGSMSMFSYDNKDAAAKEILLQQMK